MEKTNGKHDLDFSNSTIHDFVTLHHTNNENCILSYIDYDLSPDRYSSKNPNGELPELSLVLKSKNILLDEFIKTDESSIQYKILSKVLDKIVKTARKNTVDIVFKTGNSDYEPLFDVINKEDFKNVELEFIVTKKLNLFQKLFYWIFNLPKDKKIKKIVEFDKHGYTKKIVSKILSISNLIAVTSRIGQPKTILVGSNIAKILKESGMINYHTDEKVQHNESFLLEHIGTLGGAKIYQCPLLLETEIIPFLNTGQSSSRGIHVCLNDYLYYGKNKTFINYNITSIDLKNVTFSYNVN